MKFTATKTRVCRDCFQNKNSFELFFPFHFSPISEIKSTIRETRRQQSLNAIKNPLEIFPHFFPRCAFPRRAWWLWLPFMYLPACYMLKTLCSHIVPHISGRNSITTSTHTPVKAKKAAKIVLRYKNRAGNFPFITENGRRKHENKFQDAGDVDK